MLGFYPTVLNILQDSNNQQLILGSPSISVPSIPPVIFPPALSIVNIETNIPVNFSSIQKTILPQTISLFQNVEVLLPVMKSFDSTTDIMAGLFIKSTSTLALPVLSTKNTSGINTPINSIKPSNIGLSPSIKAPGAQMLSLVPSLR